MALVGHISGSTQSSSVIGISGSVIVANRPQALFPAMPGTDVKFFVEQLSLFGSEGIVSSGSLATKDPTGASTFSVVASSGNTTIGGTLATIGASTLASLTVTGNTILSGDLTVNGTTVTVNTTNLEVKDSVIGLGFASGTLQQAAGDRGWIGGLAGANNVMSKWDNAASEFAFATTTSSATGSFAITAYSNLHANNIQGSIVSASLGFSGSLTRLMDGTSYIIAGSGMTVTSASNGAITLSAVGGTGDVTGPGSSTANAVALFDGTTGKIIKNSGLTTDGSNSLFIAGTLGVSGSFEVTGNSVLSTIIEPLLNSNNSGGVTTFSLTNQSIFYVNGASSNITANFTNAQTTNNRIISTTVVLSQSATARIVSAVQIDGVASTINWANNVTPTGNSGKQDIFGFSLIRSGSAWKTLGQMTTYG